MNIGLLGGTFDPIHYGHITPLLEVQQALGLDQVWLMPNNIPPHKPQPMCSSAHRLQMARLVCQQYPQMQVCDIEIKRSSPSYSVVTLERLRAAHPNDQLLFIMGMDSFINLSSWHQWQQLFELCHLVVCQRPGWQLANDSPMQQLLEQRRGDKTSLAIATERGQYGGLILPVAITEQPYSSTQIRKQLANNTLPADAMPKVVRDYITEHQLYR